MRREGNKFGSDGPHSGSRKALGLGALGPGTRDLVMAPTFR